MLFGRVTVILLLVIAVLAFLTARIRRRLRVSPDQSSHAPLLWLVSLTADARLHRRLRSIAGQANDTADLSRRGRSAPTAAQHLARDVVREIIQIDERLVASTNLDLDAQKRMIGDLRRQADHAESLVDRVGRVINTEGTASVSPPIALDELEARLNRLEEAQNASHVIEAAAHDQSSVAELGPMHDAIPATVVESDSSLSA